MEQAQNLLFKIVHFCPRRFHEISTQRGPGPFLGEVRSTLEFLIDRECVG